MSFWMGLLAVILTATAALTGAIRLYALQRELMDVPNERSSHAVPTPRGGGLAVVVIVLLALPVLVWLGSLTVSQSLGLGGAGFLVALVGWLDDHGHVAARWRLLVHFAAAAWGLFWLGGLPDIPLLGWTLDGPWLWLPAGIFLVWLLNLYNFMDGIDGIAGVEAVTVVLCGALLAWWWVPGAEIGTALVVSAAVGGFLWWNFPPAKIFMGDAGSGFIGLFLGLLAVQAAHQAPELLWAWLILLGTFVVDASVTLVGRLLRGDVVYEAHRSHAYQHLARRWESHKRVTLLYGAVNILWLLPIAAWVVSGGLPGMVGVLVAYIPMMVLAVAAGASRPG